MSGLSVEAFRGQPGALVLADCPFVELQELVRLVSANEEADTCAFLLYADGLVQQAADHPIWDQRILYAAMSKIGWMRYLGMSRNPKRRLLLRRGGSGHETLGPLIRQDPTIAIYAVPAARTIDRSFEQHFRYLVNYEAQLARHERIDARHARLLAQVAGHPGIVWSTLTRYGENDRKAVHELVTAQTLVEVESHCEKTGRPTRTYYLRAGSTP